MLSALLLEQYLFWLCVQAGSSWVENCTRYDCMETAVGAVILASGVVCPPFNDTECIQVRTSKWTTVYIRIDLTLPNKIWKYMFVWTLWCCFPLTLFSLLVLFLQNGGIVQSYVDGCCRTCESPNLLGASGNALSCQSEGVSALLPGSGWAYWLYG